MKMVQGSVLKRATHNLTVYGRKPEAKRPRVLFLSEAADQPHSSGPRCAVASSSTQSSSSYTMPFLPGTLRVGPAW
jgi:hypothetical protein